MCAGGSGVVRLSRSWSLRIFSIRLLLLLLRAVAAKISPWLRQTFSLWMRRPSDEHTPGRRSQQPSEPRRVVVSPPSGRATALGPTDNRMSRQRSFCFHTSADSRTTCHAARTTGISQVSAIHSRSELPFGKHCTHHRSACAHSLLA